MSAWELGLVWFCTVVQAVSLVCTIVSQRRLTAAARGEEAAKTAALTAPMRGEAA